MLQIQHYIEEKDRNIYEVEVISFKSRLDALLYSQLIKENMRRKNVRVNSRLTSLKQNGAKEYHLTLSFKLTTMPILPKFDIDEAINSYKQQLGIN